ncbi:protein of unknown function [Andreprevotia lacus DSM 23236]|jgi:hypothetical protein|uniref:DUF4124 domain-containing protein n=1 Tax=Andreprevotia lacus DSM 23236 TaxID=1121001 RepID=A0A1W1XPF2_9NEIS|nr:DUF4124 domain-containing protein [Andreprevotia lacus]SMC25757.1 protein of unknown function [Andreprevotia lacus DSM 23236]
MRYLPLLAVLLLPLPAFAINVCTDAAGKVSYQDDPCPELPSNKAIQPVRASKLTPRVVQDTISRYSQALQARDYAAARRFHSSQLVVEITNKKGTARYDGRTFGEMTRRVLQAAQRYQVSTRCDTPKIEADRAMVTCQVNEQMVLNNKPMGGTSTEQYVFVLEDGQARYLSVAAKTD